MNTLIGLLTKDAIEADARTEKEKTRADVAETQLTGAKTRLTEAKTANEKMKSDLVVSLRSQGLSDTVIAGTLRGLGISEAEARELMRPAFS